MACMAGGIAVATRGMEMPEELACCVYNNVLDDNLRQILDEFNLYLKEHERESVLSLKKWSCVIGIALLPDMDDFTICWLYE